MIYQRLLKVCYVRELYTPVVSGPVDDVFTVCLEVQAPGLSDDWERLSELCGEDDLLAPVMGGAAVR